MTSDPHLTTPLADEHCARLRKRVPGIAAVERAELQREVAQWGCVVHDGVERLERRFVFADFSTALDFANRIGALADAQDHHPEIVIAWGRVTVAWWTHVAQGLHRNDFVMAAQTDRAYATMS
jgi:4a-hydroxytetrahydrobiopterin dehydratase